MKNAMEYKGYFGTVEYSEPDNILFGKVIGIDSLISYEGLLFDMYNEKYVKYLYNA